MDELAVAQCSSFFKQLLHKRTILIYFKFSFWNKVIIKDQQYIQKQKELNDGYRQFVFKFDSVLQAKLNKQCIHMLDQTKNLVKTKALCKGSLQATYLHTQQSSSHLVFLQIFMHFNNQSVLTCLFQELCRRMYTLTPNTKITKKQGNQELINSMCI